MKIGIIGGGVWGSALAKLLSENSKVMIYGRDKKIIKSINEHHFNPKLKYAIFNNNVNATNEIDALADSDYIFLALPSQNIREVMLSFKPVKASQEIIIASKGIEINSMLLLSDVVKEVLDCENVSILSGPCFSDEVAQNLPTAVTFASKNKKLFNKISSLFGNKNFRIYFSDDIIGCQIGGALKNIYAIGAGITYGLNLGENAKSAFITRSFIEIQKFGEVMGANPQTIFGLSGLGDLILTCNSIKSRNTKFGQLISLNYSLDFKEILKSQQITEGYYTTRAVKKIAENKNIDMPIVNSIYNVLYKNYSINDEINNLLNRPLDNEF
jgi:glycerol-3-phosphate dehydrogenase (NAD(P)+)